MRGSTERLLLSIALFILVAVPGYGQEAREGRQPPPSPPAQTGAVPPASNPDAADTAALDPTFPLQPKSERTVCKPANPATRIQWDACTGGDVEQIVKGCTAVIQAGDTDADCLAEAYYRRGTVHATAGDYDLAVADLSEAVSLDWYYAEAYVNRGLALDGAKLGAEADKDYALAVAITAETELAKAAQRKASERRQLASPRAVVPADFIVPPSPVAAWQGDRGLRAPEEGPEDRSTLEARSAPEEPFELVKVFYGTDRKPTGSAKPTEMFGPDRGELSFGTCEVSIPRTHVMGELEDAGTFQSLDPSRHIMLQKVSALNEQDFLNELKQRMAASPGKKALLYVHGFNVSFRDAARRAAQLHKDLSFDGVPMFYSWPSQANPLSYVVDSTNAEWSVATLKGFLKEVATGSGVDRIYVVAHSMGTYVLSNALTRLLSEDPALASKFAVVVLAAPDIDAAVFKRDLAPRLAAGGGNVALYSSNTDKALWTSRRLHGYQRAGDSTDGALIADGIDTIDAGGIDMSYIGHSYYAGAKPVLEDIASLLKTGDRAGQRQGLKALQGYWQIVAGNP